MRDILTAKEVPKQEYTTKVFPVSVLSHIQQTQCLDTAASLISRDGMDGHHKQWENQA